jgi:hypothetical protein
MARGFALDLIAVLSTGINAPGNPSYMAAPVPIVALVSLTDLKFSISTRYGPNTSVQH